MKVSVLILTLNEEQNLPRCLKALGWCDDIVVLDSFSKDRTQAITEASGARFIQREFDDYAKQRNYGLNEVKYKFSWVFMVDADEVVSKELSQEIRDLSETDNDICIYRMRRKDHFMGTWIKRSSGYPTWFGRLLRVGRTHVERSINEEYHTDGNIGNLNNHLLHYPFNKGFHNWMSKHNRYSTMEALKKDNSSLKDLKLSLKQFGDPVFRRKIVKEIIYKIPARPIIMFLLLYIFRLGFLDGRAGFSFCVLRAFYEYMIDCKVKEMKLRKQNLPL